MNKTLTNIIYFFVAIVLAKFIGGFTTIFLAKILQPADYGVWMTMLLIVSYSPIVCFGTVETLVKQFPYHVGKGDLHSAKEVEDGVLGSIVLSSLLFLLVGFTFHILITIKSLEPFITLVRLIVIASVLGFFIAYFFYRFMAHQNFKSASIIEIVGAISTLFFLIIFSWVWGLKGTAFGFLINELVICICSIFLSHRTCGKVGINFNFKLIWKFIQIGFPISAFWWIFIIQASIDRVISMSMLGKTTTGYYALGVSILSIIILIPQAVNRVLFPKINEKVGENSNEKELFRIIIIPTQILNLILPLIIGILLPISPIIYYKILPKYGPGLASAQILLLWSFFRLMIGNGVNFLIAKNKQNLLVGYVVISLICNVAVSIVLVKYGFNIEGIALSTGVSGALLASLIWKSVFKHMGYSIFNQWKEIFHLYLPFLVFLGLIIFLSMIVPEFLKVSGMISLLHILLLIGLFLTASFAIPALNRRIKELYYLAREYV